MFRYFLKPHLINHKSKHCILTIFRFIQTQSASNITKFTDKQSLTVSYLTDSCGLSVESAISASRSVDIKNRERSNSVLELLRSHGFSPKDISTLISRYPRIIMVCAVTNLGPKIEFFESLGIVGSKLPATFLSCNKMVFSSLNKTIKPTFDFLKCYINTSENVPRTLKVMNRLCRQNLEKCIMPNVETLRDHKVPHSQIGKFIIREPSSLTVRPDMFKALVNAVTEMGFDQKHQKFISAVGSMSILSQAKWDRKKEVLLSHGWTESDFDLAFNLQPQLLRISETKIKDIMNFLVDKVGVKASDVARFPNILMASLEKRLIPRWSVLQVLKSKGKIGENSISYIFSPSKTEFEARFVMKYKDEFPEVINVYKSGRIALGSNQLTKNGSRLPIKKN